MIPALSKMAVAVGAASCLMFTSVPASAALSQIMTPDAAYTSATTQIDISGLTTFSDYPSITDGSLTVSFSSPMNKRVAPGDGWATWGSPPDTEPTPTPILFSNGLTSIIMSFSMDLTTFGIEVEPNPFAVHDFTMEFFDGLTSLGSILRSADGSAGARLLAGTSDIAFDSVVVSSDVDWSAGRFRYATPGEVPEPASMALMGLALAGLAAVRRRRLNA